MAEVNYQYRERDELIASFSLLMGFAHNKENIEKQNCLFRFKTFVSDRLTNIAYSHTLVLFYSFT